MLSPLQVLRYSALGLGLFYGFYHQLKITSSEKAAAAKREYEHKQSLINQAKAEYSKLKNPAPAAASASGRKFCLRSGSGNNRTAFFFAILHDRHMMDGNDG